MRTAWVRRETGVDVLDDREGLRRYTQAGVSCLGPDCLIVVKRRCWTLRPGTRTLVRMRRCSRETYSEGRLS